MDVVRGGERSTPQPYISVCIPQYNRTPFLIESVRALGRQTFRDFEICISDDCSTDGRESDLLAALRATGLPFVYERQQRNLRYDANLRASIALSCGRYCYLLGNDDCLAADDELEQLHAMLEQHPAAGVVISNFVDLMSGQVVRRMPRSGELGSGPEIAASNFRNFSFVSGVVLHGERARALSTDKWDGSEMYQMYLGCRILAEGKSLLARDRVAVGKDIQIAGEAVDSYARRARLEPCLIVERKHTFHLLPQLVFDALRPHLLAAQQPAMLEYLMTQVVLFIYPYWVFEYRKIQSWNYAAGICLGMRPRNLVAPSEQELLGLRQRARMLGLYLAVSAASLTTPGALFANARPLLHRASKAGVGLSALRWLSGRAS